MRSMQKKAFAFCARENRPRGKRLFLVQLSKGVQKCPNPGENSGFLFFKILLDPTIKPSWARWAWRAVGAQAP